MKTINHLIDQKVHPITGLKPPREQEISTEKKKEYNRLYRLRNK